MCTSNTSDSMPTYCIDTNNTKQISMRFQALVPSLYHVVCQVVNVLVIITYRSMAHSQYAVPVNTLLMIIPKASRTNVLKAVRAKSSGVLLPAVVVTRRIRIR